MVGRKQHISTLPCAMQGASGTPSRPQRGAPTRSGATASCTSRLQSLMYEKEDEIKSV